MSNDLATEEVVTEILKDYKGDVNKYAQKQGRAIVLLICFGISLLFFIIPIIIFSTTGLFEIGFCVGHGIFWGIISLIIALTVGLCFGVESYKKKFCRKLASKMELSAKRDSARDLLFFDLLKTINITEVEDLKVFCLKYQMESKLAIATFKNGKTYAEKRASQSLSKFLANIEMEAYHKEGLPWACPGCHRQLGGDVPKKWEIISSATTKGRALDKAYTLAGATTIFTKEVSHTVKTYKCPYCGFTHTC